MLRKWLTVYWQSCYSLVADTSTCDKRVKNKKRGGLLLLIRISSSLRLSLTLLLALVLLASGAAPAAAQSTSQESDQDAESGEIGQSGEVLNSGDNSNQCVALQPVANTGNAETEVDIIIETPEGDQFTKRAKINKRDREKPSDHQYNERDHDRGNDNDNNNNNRQRPDIIDISDLADELDLDLEDIGSTIELSPEQKVECNQAVNQAATASDTSDAGSCSWYWEAGWWCLWSTDGSWWFQDYPGSWTAYDAGYWSWDGSYWWWTDGHSWWWTDGYYWYPWGLYNAASNVAEGALNGSGSLATLGVLATLGLAGTGLVIRRNRNS